MKNIIKRKYKLFFWVLFFLGAAVRLYGLGQYPSGFFRDEAALGYNAYSILKTGRDEFGMALPIVFRSFEVFFLPAYVYLSAPLVGIFGLSEFSARLLSAVSGIVGLSLVWFIAKEIWEDKKAAVFSVLVLVISPWHIFYSRGAFEGNLALTFFCAGFLFWLKFLRTLRTESPELPYQRSETPYRKPQVAAHLHLDKAGLSDTGVRNNKGKQFFLSGFFFLLSMYSYQAERLVVPLFLLLASFFSRNLLWRLKKQLILPAIILLLFSLPLLSLSFKAGGYHRAAGVTVFSQEEHAPGWIKEEKQNLFVNNEVYLRARQLTALYLSYFSPRNLFFGGDYNHQRSTENLSVFYGWMLPFLIWGIGDCLKNRNLKKSLLLTWTLLAPLPAALTGDPFNTYRSLLSYFPFSLLIGMGIIRAAGFFRHKTVFPAAIALLSFSSFALFLFSYFALTPVVRAKAWDYGYREIIRFIKDLPPETPVVIDDSWTTPYIHLLFFGKTDPKIYQEEVAKLGPLDYYYTDSRKIRPEKIGNVEFREVDWRREGENKKAIFIMAGERLLASELKNMPYLELVKEIYYPAEMDTKVAFRIVRIRP